MLLIKCFCKDFIVGNECRKIELKNNIEMESSLHS